MYFRTDEHADGRYSAAEKSPRPNEEAHLSPVVKDNDGAVLVVHGDRAYVTLP